MRALLLLFIACTAFQTTVQGQSRRKAAAQPLDSFTQTWVLLGNDSFECIRLSESYKNHLHSVNSGLAINYSAVEADLNDVQKLVKQGLKPAEYSLNQVQIRLDQLQQQGQNVNHLYTELSFYKNAEKSLKTQVPKTVTVASAPSVATREEKALSPESAIREANMSALSSHGLLTQFNSIPLNDVDTKLSSFLYKMGLREEGDRKFDMSKPTKTVEAKYVPSISANGKQNASHLKVKYLLSVSGSELIVNSCEVTGSYDLVVSLYVKYWNTSLNFQDVKGRELVSNRLLDDRISLQTDLPNNYARITIEPFK